jgi:hypothetical protein
MPTTIIDQSSFDSDIEVPANGDKNYGPTVQSAVQKLANRTTWLKDNQSAGTVSPINGLSNPSGSVYIQAGNNISIADNGVDTIIINSQDISGYVTYAEVAGISGNLQNQINSKQNNIILVAGSNVNIVESPIDTWTISVSISGAAGIEYVTAPTSPTDIGTQGQRAYSSNYVYECIATNTWVRYAAASSW